MSHATTENIVTEMVSLLFGTKHYIILIFSRVRKNSWKVPRWVSIVYKITLLLKRALAILASAIFKYGKGTIFVVVL